MQVNNIPTKFLKYANVLIAPILTNINNECIREGIFAENLKTSQIIPVCKKFLNIIVQTTDQSQG